METIVLQRGVATRRLLLRLHRNAEQTQKQMNARPGAVMFTGFPVRFRSGAVALVAAQAHSRSQKGREECFPYVLPESLACLRGKSFHVPGELAGPLGNSMPASSPLYHVTD
ncbi:hypothetical protein SKAU_G00058530 [Synaphobranchus kaupii]|uniref:Uncharacterized protein n=1 Tax=Synaphobranchus kaupii TaxID=118154 RepID=A0A9Q1JA51_SYNKA|nr:hypothetical protein SKAU_G00058530 [Synaphobranchus kaupii]